MARISIAASFEPVEVDLWDHLFHTKPITKSVARSTDELGDKINEAEAAGDADKIVALLGEVFDALLQAADAKRTKPSALISKKWDSDELSLPQLIEFSEELTTSQRPT